jgi:hypothetical protein
MPDILSRRSLLRQTLKLPLALFVANVGAGNLLAAEAGNLCVDSSKMDADQKSIRDSLHYAETSPDPAKTCSGCGFFQPTANGCGTCMIFNGFANGKGHCDSWSPKG